jgi:hypothetical protein
MRHSFVSLLSDSGIPIEQIARLVGHAGGSEVTEKVYRHQVRPVLIGGAESWTVSSLARSQMRSRSHSVVPMILTERPDRACELEPPIGIEPMTYSLRVNRSAD